ncbi:MAG TPA: amidohydrolase family protein [bacterium]|nr:amidohydrolase family protein [bacterium]HPS29697.1 amidohydrolase family protein [bacterium]
MYFFKNFYIYNLDKSGNLDFFKGSLLVENTKIKKIIKNDGAEEKFSIPENTEIIEGNYRAMIAPGFIQTHIHMCQTSHRNMAENIPLLPWLRDHIWPFEASLTRKTIGISVISALKELVSSGTVSVLDMGTVRHSDVIFEIMEIAGFRYTGGKAMMDSGVGIPEQLLEKTADSIDESLRLLEKYHNTGNGLLRYAFAPRFVLSCSETLLKEVRKLSDRHNILIQTHGSEHKEEVEYIRSKTGLGNISFLNKIDALNDKTVIAHSVHPDEIEIALIKDINASIVHCPSTNLKLGSGIAPIFKYLQKGIKVGVGADGAPCNNALNIFSEIKMASLLQKGINHDATIMSAKDALKLATVNGAEILGLSDTTGQVIEGFDADLVILNMDTPQTLNFECHPSAALVYGCDPRNVLSTMVAGKFLFKDGFFSDEINDLEKFFRDMI